MKVVFATHNAHKVAEINAIVAPKGIEVISLSDINYRDDIPEPYETIRENAIAKAQTIWQKFQLNCFAEDSGLEVDSLCGEPGVLSARYAGEHRSDSDNIQLLLHRLASHTDRQARFRTVIALIWENKLHVFEGTVEGTIQYQPNGEGGFGYDPIFQPENEQRTFAEMSPAEKNAISHRGKATVQLIDFLQKKSLFTQ